MTFKNYQTRNNIAGFLDAGISPTTETLILKAEYADLFPEITIENPKTYLATIEQFDAENNVNKREIVEVIAKALNVLTIVRSAGYCPANFEATEYTNTAFSFLAGDKISMYVVAENDKDMKDEIERKAYDNEVVHLTGDEQVDGIKDFLKFPILPTANPTENRQAVSKQYLDLQIVDAQDKANRVNNFFIFGEDVGPLDSLFIERKPKHEEIVSSLKIGEKNEVKRVAFNLFPNNVVSDEVGLSIMKKGSPVVNFKINFETDDNGPSGTLVDDPNSVRELDYNRIDTKVKRNEYAPKENLSGVYYGTSVISGNVPRGYRIQAKANSYLYYIEKTPLTTSTEAYLKDDAGNILYTATFVGDRAYFETPIELVNGTYYRPEVSISSNHQRNKSVTFPISRTFIDYIGGSESGGAPVNPTYGYSIVDIGIDTYSSMAFPKLPQAISESIGNKIRAVCYQGTYGSETVSSSDFYEIGGIEVQTNTTEMKRFDGTDWLDGFLPTKLESTTNSMASSGEVLTRRGDRYMAKRKIFIDYVVKNASCTATTAYLISDDGLTIYETATFVGGVAKFSGLTSFNNGDYFRIEANSGATTYNMMRTVPTTFQEYFNINIVQGSEAGANSMQGGNIVSVGSFEENANSILPSLFGGFFADELYSKTSSLYVYKLPDIPRFSKQSYTAGQLGKAFIGGEVPGFGDFVSDVGMFISDVDGLISASPGTIPYGVGRTISKDILKLGAFFQYQFNKDTTYRAYQDGILNGLTPVSAGNSLSVMAIEIGETPTTMTTFVFAGNSGSPTVCCPVFKGQYFKLTSTITTTRGTFSKL